MVNITSIIMILIIISIFIITAHTAYKTIRESVPALNNCLEEETYHYRFEGGWLFGREVETNKENADGQKQRCIKWEEEPSLGKAMLGQKQIMKEA